MINNFLPTCAFTINGDFLEDLVPGYHTLDAKTQKLTITKEFRTADTAIKSGAILLGSRYPVREIEIEYLIEADNPTDRQDAYTKLMGYLDTEQAQIIFNGEPDKYVTGSFYIENDIDTTYWTGHGTYKIYCVDPFKYSTTEQSVTADNGQFLVNYQGEYKAYPKFNIEFPAVYDADGDNTNTSECGYVGLANTHDDVLQFGDPEQTDWADVQHPATRPLNFEFKSVNDWTLNNAQVLTGTQVGTVTVSDNSVKASGYSTGTAYHGPSLSRILTGEVAPIPTNFKFSWNMKIAGTKSQFGVFEALLYNNDSGTRTLVGGVHITKLTKDTKCAITFRAGSVSKKITGIKCSSVGSCAITKSEDTFTFSIAGKTQKLVNDVVSNLVANEVVFYFAKNKTQTPLGTLSVSKCVLERTSYTNYEDVPNTFAPGDFLEIDTQTADVMLNDIPAQYLGALGNDWEDFYLRKGSNIIAVDYSDFTTTPPVFTMKYRERFI